MKKRTRNDEGDFWPSISDLMSGLMIIFMFIAVSFMLDVGKQKTAIENEKEVLEVAIKKYKDGKLKLYTDLFVEFENDLDRWNATLDKENLSISFNEPDILFNRGEKEINDKFKGLLNDFFPRYVEILSSDMYKEEIEEVRIEGHTSSEWNQSTSSLGSYFKNMELSQARTVETLKYVMLIPSLKKSEIFLIEKLTANGLSYSKRIYENGRENYAKSRRVEFKIRTKAEKYLDEMFRKIEERNKGEQNG